MVKFETNGTNGNVVLNLPTQFSDITPKFLEDIVDNIVIADNYSLIALFHKEKLSSFVMAGKNKKNEISTAVVPVFVKRGRVTRSDSASVATLFENTIKTGDKLLITPTVLSMGLHVNVPRNTLTMGHLLKYIDGDGYAYQNALKLKEEVYFLEFKIVPNCDILGVYKDNDTTNFDNPFKVERKSDIII